ncbi:hypothetical protein [Roseovarius nitratireducens]|uniref:hypothetical protein n=1 Tax=Roseovarius nitratireducens TaxID=2044597 RepID=UPI000CE1FB70|nr:hypothetical protein [Roseovarius nitratireducens]
MSGLGSFIQGAFQGYEYGESVKDRKTQRKRDKERHEWARENQEWRRENNDWASDQRDRQREAWERADDERDTLSDIHRETREGYESGTAAPEPRPGEVSSRGPTDARPQARGVVDAPSDRPRPQMRPRSIAPQPSVSSEGPQQPAVPGQQGKGPVAPQPPQDAAPAMQQPTQTMQPGRSVRGVAGEQGAPMPRIFAEHPRAQQAAQQAGIGLEALWARMRPEGQRTFIEMDGGAAGPQPTPTPPQTRPQSDPSGRPQMGARQPAAPEARPGPQAPQQFPQGGAVQRAAPDGRGVARQTDGPGPISGPEQPAPRDAAQRPPERPGAPGAAPKVGNIDVREASTEELDAQATQNPPDQGGAPSVEAAGAAVQETAQSSRGVVGQGTGKVNPEDEERASQTFMQYYAENAAPKIVEYYLSQGDVEKATAFQEWADSQKVKGQMASWSKAIWAITNGDEDRFVDHLSATYNAIDDGLSIDPKKTKFKHDKDGNIIGGTLAVINDETGETSITEYDNQQDIVEMAVYALAPEQTFEYLWGLSQQARELRIKKQGGIEPLDLAKEIRREADSIRSSQEFASAETRMSEQQIEEIARQNVYRRLGATTGASTGQDAAVGAGEPPRLR